MTDNLFPYIDYTILDIQATPDQISELGRKGQLYNVASCCVRLSALQNLKHAVRKTVVTNFPSGNSQTIEEIQQDIQTAKEQKADELDFVFPYQQYLSGQFSLDQALEFCSKIVKLASPMKVKIIVESGEIPSTEKLREIVKIAIQSQPDFIKTSTGYTPVGATPEHAEIILKCIQEKNPNMGFKVSGGIRTPEQAKIYIDLAKKYMPEFSPHTFRIGASSLVDNIVSLNKSN